MYYLSNTNEWKTGLDRVGAVRCRTVYFSFTLKMGFVVGVSVNKKENKRFMHSFGTNF